MSENSLCAGCDANASVYKSARGERSQFSSAVLIRFGKLNTRTCLARSARDAPIRAPRQGKGATETGLLPPA